MFQPANKTQTRLRMTIDGPAGSGKTFTALRFAHALTQVYPGKIAVLDTERGSAAKYAGDAPDGIPWAFDYKRLEDFAPDRYTEVIEAAGRMGYSVLVVDSLSHAWEGTGGALETKQKYGEAWSAWRFVTPMHNRMVDAILQSNCHIITTMRSRTEYVQETDPATNKTTVRRIGLAPVQRPGMEYEFDLVCDMDWSHILTVSKTRCSAVDGKVVEKPGPAFLQPVIDWLKGGAIPAPAPVTFAAPVAPAPVITVTLEQLLGLFSPEQIMSANAGKLPATDAEVQQVAHVLMAG